MQIAVLEVKFISGTGMEFFDILKKILGEKDPVNQVLSSLFTKIISWF